MLTSASSQAGLLFTGVAAGLQFNPLAAAASSAIAAGVSGYPRAPRSRLWWSAAVLALGWAAGDGLAIAGSSDALPHLAAWGVTGLAFGYVLPALTGGYVGRQVHKGTGYLSAGAVALMLVPALSLLAEVLAKGLWRLVA